MAIGSSATALAVACANKHAACRRAPAQPTSRSEDFIRARGATGRTLPASARGARRSLPSQAPERHSRRPPFARALPGAMARLLLGLAE
jgi:hypothetical protein